ncbi:hypothetical protein RRG08_038205 [Elysia crispata]|uniref:Uncharacterized protein n=1 Tax=Elysia crispata TaxID=231223 RepID=A0AAE1AMZ4_9GAST|nr:hypothetical protein RRG08_038205 [Elysia crispata]
MISLSVASDFTNKVLCGCAAVCACLRCYIRIISAQWATRRGSADAGDSVATRYRSGGFLALDSEILSVAEGRMRH